MSAVTVLTIELSYQEVKRLHDEIGAIPKKKVGPKLLQLYRRLDDLVGATWLEEDPEKKRKRRGGCGGILP